MEPNNFDILSEDRWNGNNSDNNGNGNNVIKIRSAIDLLLSSELVKCEPTVELTQCSPHVDVVMNKQGGICTHCNILFKSRTSLLHHLETCNNNNNVIVPTTVVKLVVNKPVIVNKPPRLIIKSN